MLFFSWRAKPPSEHKRPQKALTNPLLDDQSELARDFQLLNIALTTPFDFFQLLLSLSKLLPNSWASRSLASCSIFSVASAKQTSFS